MVISIIGISAAAIFGFGRRRSRSGFRAAARLSGLATISPDIIMMKAAVKSPRRRRRKSQSTRRASYSRRADKKILYIYAALYYV